MFKPKLVELFGINVGISTKSWADPSGIGEDILYMSKNIKSALK
jgi:hypothetical protein